MKCVAAVGGIALLIILSACASTPPPTVIERQFASEPGQPEVVIDYTRDWESIIGPRRYPVYITQILMRRRNWRMTLSGEWIDDLVEDFQRRYRWDKKLQLWVAEKGNPEWPE